MKSLEKILGNQKQRGIFGEIQLENLRRMFLDKRFFKCRTHLKVVNYESIIKVNENIIPIDATSKLTTYQNDRTSF